MVIEVLAEGLEFPEGPAFDPQGGIWGVEMRAGGLFRWTSEKLERVPVGGAPNGLALRDGDVWFCDAEHGSVRRLISGGTVEVVTDGGLGVRLNRPNDLIFDSYGSLIFTCPGLSAESPNGDVWLFKGGELKRLASGMNFPNGLALTPDGRDLLVAETLSQRLWRGRWDRDAGDWINPRPWVEVGGPLGPDGMAFGPDGLLYVALYGQGRIRAFAEDGTLRRDIAVPGAKPTNIAFDPTERLGMVVTEAEHGLLIGIKL